MRKPEILLPFLFQKYVNPIWYFNLIPIVEGVVSTAHHSGLNKEYRDLLEEDNRYLSHEAKYRDKGLQGWEKGLMLLANTIDLKSHVTKTPVGLIDNYIFLRKNYSRHWSFYVLFRRILSLNHPIAELKAFLQTSRVRLSPNKWLPHATHAEYFEFQSKLLSSAPLVSVIIPTLSRYRYLKDILLDLEKQEYKNFEVIVCDQTDQFDESFYNQFNLNIIVKRLTVKGQWNARNTGVKLGKGDFIAFTEDDVRIKTDWISQHIKVLDYFKCDISAGVFYPEGTSIPTNRSFFRWAEQFASGNAMVRKEVFYKIGLFDMQFERMRNGDGEFGCRAYLNGLKSVSNPLACCIDVKAPVGGLRQMGSWDAFRPKKVFAPRPIPSVLYFYRKYFPLSHVMNALVIGLLPSLVPYKFRNDKKWFPVAVISSLLFSPIFFIQVIISWQRSTKMLREGSKIEWLKT